MVGVYSSNYHRPHRLSASIISVKPKHKIVITGGLDTCCLCFWFQSQQQTLRRHPQRLTACSIATWGREETRDWSRRCGEVASLFPLLCHRCPECWETCGPASFAGLLDDHNWQALRFLAAVILVQSEGRIFCPHPECSAPLLPAADHGCNAECYSIDCPHCSRYATSGRLRLTAWTAAWCSKDMHAWARQALGCCLAVDGVVKLI